MQLGRPDDRTEAPQRVVHCILHKADQLAIQSCPRHLRLAGSGQAVLWMPRQRHGGARNCKGRSDAFGRRKPGRAGYRAMVAKAQPLPAKRRLSSGLSAAYQLDGRRRKIESAVPLIAMKNPLVTTPINQPLQFRPKGPGGGGWSVGATGLPIRLRSGRRGAWVIWFCSERG